jgi:putative two-component system response regulator
VLTTHLAAGPGYRDTIDDAFVDALYAASPLHDLGKIAIADGILLKPGKLTPEEFTLMKRHTTIGARTLREVARRTGGNPFLEVGHELALYHHERWDGTGYPFGLARAQIPLGARIVALADVYDALTSQRCYKRAFTHAEARASIVAEAGRHFDPDLVEAFVQRERDFIRIRAAITSDVPLYGEDAPGWVRELRVRGAA